MNKIKLCDLKKFCEEALVKSGVSQNDAETVTDVLITTDTFGVMTHGTKNLNQYIQKMEAGGLDAKADPSIVAEGPAFAIINGNKAIGMVSAAKAMNLAVEKAKQVGIAYVGVKNSCHFGAAGYYANLAAKEGLIGLSMSNADPVIAVPNGSKKAIGTNPFSFAAPTGDGKSIFLDIALSNVAALKVIMAQEKNMPIPDTWLVDEEGIPKVCDHFNKNGVDAVIIIAANFGNEEAAGLLGKKLGKPVLLWGPKDDAPEEDGMRYTDSQCGLFGISRMLMRMNVKFSYIENSPVDSEKFAKGLESFARVACAVKNFYGMRIGQVGLRPRPFSSVICNEGQLMEEFDIHFVPVNLAIIQDKFNTILKNRAEELKVGATKLRGMYEMDDVSDETAEKQYAYILLFKELFEELNLDCISAECWSALQLLVGAMPCTAYGVLADEGYIISCENDVHAAMTQVVLKSLSFGKAAPLFGEFTIRHPEDDNVELLWHCGQFAYSMRKPGSFCKCINMRENFETKAGHFTVARIDQDHGKYSIVAGECDSAEGPYTNGTYIWAKFDDLDAWERKLIEGPYIHHVSEIEGSFTNEIKDFCKFVTNLEFDPVK